jgi:hypothetical protein
MAAVYPAGPEPRMSTLACCELVIFSKNVISDEMQPIISTSFAQRMLVKENHTIHCILFYYFIYYFFSASYGIPSNLAG